ncbi:MAG: lamin tail domain-containing protein [Phycisphaeraceae bacterium]|nr:lamin tail domain-containing protein [Phycisphaeraceae bacterium]
MVRTKMVARGALALVAMAGGAGAQVITQWDFNVPGGNGSPVLGTLTPAVGSGTVLRFGRPNLAFRSGSATGGSSDPAASIDNSALDLSPWGPQGTESGQNGVEFVTSTAGFSDIVVSFDIRHSNRMSRYVQFQYSTDGTTFTSAGLVNNGIYEATNDGDVWYNQRIADLTQIAGVNNNPNFRFRLVAVFVPGETFYVASGLVPYDTGGRARIDMVTVRQQVGSSEPQIEADTLPKAACGFGIGEITIVGDVVPGTNPPSTNLTVTADLSPIGGSPTQQLFDDGTNGDAVAGDGRFTYVAQIPGSVTLGQKPITLTVTDGQGRSASDTENFRVVDCSGASDAPVVISQVYGGGGNFGAFYNSDYVELFNRTSEPVNISTWSLQYASDRGSFGDSENILFFPANTIIPPHSYYLIQTTNAIGVYGAPFIADRVATPGFGVGQTDGKVALVNTQTLLPSIDCPITDTRIVDFVGFGIRTNCSEGGSSTLNTNVGTAVFRKIDGCQDTNQNFHDFYLDEPNPRSLASDPWVCQTVRCYADYNEDGGVDGADVEAFFIDWESGGDAADVNQDGGVDGADVEAFFLQWEAGGC